jgi:HK97 family phage portal protein
MISSLARILGYEYLPGVGIEPDANYNKLFAAFFGAYGMQYANWNDGKAEAFINEGYRGNAAIYSIVNKIMQKDCEPTLQAFKESGRKSHFNKATKFKGTDLSIAETRLYLKKDLNLVESGQLMTLLKNPNKSQTQYSFFQDISMYWRMTGEFFIYGRKIGIGRDAEKFDSMYVLPSHLVEVIQGDMLEPVVGYKFTIGDQQIVFRPDEVLHVKTPNPYWTLGGTQLRGQSALLAGWKYLKKNSEAIESLYRAVMNEGAKGFLSPYPVTDPNLWFNSTQLASLKDQVQSGIEGRLNKNKIAAMGVPMAYTDMAKTPQDLDTLKAMDSDFKMFCNLWGVNPAIFAHDGKYDNMMQAMKLLVTDVSMPFLNQLEQALSSWLLPRYKGEADYLEFDTTTYAELQPDVKLILDTYGKHPAFTWNEIRVMLGWDEIDGELGETYWVPTNIIPAEQAIQGNPDFQDFSA